MAAQAGGRLLPGFLKHLVYPLAVLGAGVGAEVWIHGRQLEAVEERITKATQEQIKATQEQVKATVGSEVTKSMEQFKKELLASMTKVVQEEVTVSVAKAVQEKVPASVAKAVQEKVPASVAKAVQEEVTPMKATLQHIQGRVEYLDSASMKITNMMLANCQKTK